MYPFALLNSNHQSCWTPVHTNLCKHHLNWVQRKMHLHIMIIKRQMYSKFQNKMRRMVTAVILVDGKRIWHEGCYVYFIYNLIKPFFFHVYCIFLKLSKCGYLIFKPKWILIFFHVRSAINLLAWLDTCSFCTYALCVTEAFLRTKLKDKQNVCNSYIFKPVARCQS